MGVDMPFDEKDGVFALNYFQRKGYQNIFEDLGFKGNEKKSDEVDLARMQSVFNESDLD